MAGEASYRNKRRNGRLYPFLLYIAVPKNLQSPWGEFSTFLLSSWDHDCTLRDSLGRSSVVSDSPTCPPPCHLWFYWVSIETGTLVLLELPLSMSTEYKALQFCLTVGSWSRTFFKLKKHEYIFVELHKAFPETICQGHSCIKSLVIIPTTIADRYQILTWSSLSLSYAFYSLILSTASWDRWCPIL